MSLICRDKDMFGISPEIWRHVGVRVGPCRQLVRIIGGVRIIGHRHCARLFGGFAVDSIARAVIGAAVGLQLVERGSEGVRSVGRGARRRDGARHRDGPGQEHGKHGKLHGKHLWNSSGAAQLTGFKLPISLPVWP
ncbi:hypothetical protein [Mesobacterium pallidum]|uniref:hypothetical protein n=1 Tax=Mesobacterium pallidum TaxID=2872037 RepID=UPI001EE1FB37|nr:hypothetical protein [Mesobacterium pallidum]